MFKSSTVLLCLLSIAVAMEVPNLPAFKEFLDSENDSPTCKRETAKFKHCFNDVTEDAKEFQNSTGFPSRKEVLAKLPEIHSSLKCVGEVTCNKLVLLKYIIESGAYALEKFFDKGYECLNENNMKQALMFCLIQNMPSEAVETHDVRFIATQAKPIARCVATAQKCQEPAKKEFLKGAVAFGELLGVVTNLGFAAQAGDNSYIEKFGKKFDRAEFDQLEL